MLTYATEMQKAVGHANAPHPELKVVLQEEIAKIEPKVAEGTVTIEEANHLHSLEARAHGHTEKGGIASIAQSVAAKRERALSLSSSGAGSSPISNRSRANSRPVFPQEQSPITKHKVSEGSAAEKSYLTAGSPSFVSQKRNASLSDQTNTSARASMYSYHKDMSQDLGGKMAQMGLSENEVKGENVVGKDQAVHKRENSQPVV